MAIFTRFGLEPEADWLPWSVGTAPRWELSQVETSQPWPQPLGPRMAHLGRCRDAVAFVGVLVKLLAIGWFMGNHQWGSKCREQGCTTDLAFQTPSTCEPPARGDMARRRYCFRLLEAVSKDGADADFDFSGEGRLVAASFKIKRSFILFCPIIFHHFYELLFVLL